jgi:hypothetical protein
MTVLRTAAIPTFLHKLCRVRSGFGPGAGAGDPGTTVFCSVVEDSLSNVAHLLLPAEGVYSCHFSCHFYCGPSDA